MEIPLASYRSYWKRAKKNTSSYPDALSFAIMKAGATSSLISQMECMLANIPLKTGYSPRWMKRCIDIMILKKSGITSIENLCTRVLFPVDCNYVFKHIGQCMMSNAEQAKALAPEQYGSRKRHRAINLVTSKALTYDLFRQLRHPIHGIGQGNGAGPAIWAFISTPLLNILWEHGFGFKFTAPVSGLRIRFAGFAFVDDTDLLQML